MIELRYIGVCIVFSLCACVHNPQFVSNFSSHWPTLKKQVISQDLELEAFYAQGPFSFREFLDFNITISPKHRVNTDFFRTSNRFNPALAVIVHGNGYNKFAHRVQAERIASWGFHCLVLNLPNRNYWLENGKKIKRLISLIRSYPRLLARNINPNRIYLIGHSFGGSASVLATGYGAPVRGLILLDPAMVHDSVKDALPRVSVPSVILGADKRVFKSKRRSQFFQHIGGPIAEVSIIGATHTDAQYPSIHKVHWGFDLVTNRHIQNRFLGALIASLFSLTSSDRLEFAWYLFRKEIKKGHMKKARVKFVPDGVHASLKKLRY
ncbi:MAG: alpha/beta hydrolase [Oligoflexales bacterium]|nr:alpha/beta hydrolase [Oligoflexales bacterium]